MVVMRAAKFESPHGYKEIIGRTPYHDLEKGTVLIYQEYGLENAVFFMEYLDDCDVDECEYDVMRLLEGDEILSGDEIHLYVKGIPLREFYERTNNSFKILKELPREYFLENGFTISKKVIDGEKVSIYTKQVLSEYNAISFSFYEIEGRLYVGKGLLFDKEEYELFFQEIQKEIMQDTTNKLFNRVFLEVHKVLRELQVLGHIKNYEKWMYLFDIPRELIERMNFKDNS